MDDLISRQDAIDILKKRHDEILPYDETISGALSGAIKLIKTLPSSQKKGHWIEDGYYDYKAVCSECGEPCATYTMDKPRDRFCKWCGADMRNEEVENER